MPIFIRLGPWPSTTNIYDFFLKKKRKRKTREGFWKLNGGASSSQEESSLSVAHFGVSVRGFEISMVGVGLSGRRSFHWRENLKTKQNLDSFLGWQKDASAVLKHFLPVTARLLLYHLIKKDLAIWAGQTICLHQTGGGEGLNCPRCFCSTQRTNLWRVNLTYLSILWWQIWVPVMSPCLWLCIYSISEVNKLMWPDELFNKAP